MTESFTVINNRIGKLFLEEYDNNKNGKLFFEEYDGFWEKN